MCAVIGVLAVACTYVCIRTAAARDSLRPNSCYAGVAVVARSGGMTKTAGVIIGAAVGLCASYMLQTTSCGHRRPAAASRVGNDNKPRRGRLVEAVTVAAQDTSNSSMRVPDSEPEPEPRSHQQPQPAEPEPEPLGLGAGVGCIDSSVSGGWGAAATAAVSSTSSGSSAGWGVRAAPGNVHSTDTDTIDPPDITKDAPPDASGWAAAALDSDQPGSWPPAPEAIRRQVHHYFSTHVLLREGDRVMQLIDEDVAQGGQGFVELAELLAFANMKKLFAGAGTVADDKTRLELVADALRESTQLELSVSERSVRRRDPLPDRDEYYAAIAVVENASLAEASDPVLDLAQQQLQQRKPAIDLFRRARVDLQDGIRLYLSGDHKGAQQLFHYCRVKMVARGEQTDDARPVGLGHPMFARNGSNSLTRAEREKRGCFWDASRLNMAVCQLSIGVANGNVPETLTAALRTLQQIRRKDARLLDVEPKPGDGNLHRNLLDDTVEMLALKASALIIAAEVTLALGQQHQARRYLRDCERVYTAASKRSLAENGTEAGFARMLEERSAELDASRVSAIAAATIATPNGDGAVVLTDTQPEPELEVRPSGNPLAGVKVPAAMINQAFSVWKKHIGHDPLENISASHGEAVGAAVHAACIDAIAFAAFDDVSERKEFPARLITSATADISNANKNSLDTHRADLEGQVRNFVRRFAEQVLRLDQKSVGENDSRHLVLSKPLSYRLPLDEDQNVRACCDCATLGQIGVHFTKSQWNKAQSRCKVCTQRQGLNMKRADIERLREKVAAEDRNVASALTYLLKLPTQAAIDVCRAKLEDDRKEQDRRGFGLRAGFLN